MQTGLRKNPSVSAEQMQRYVDVWNLLSTKDAANGLTVHSLAQHCYGNIFFSLAAGCIENTYALYGLLSHVTQTSKNHKKEEHVV